jgi:phosphoribosylformylglycinamidine synthase
MAASAIDEAVRNCLAVGARFDRIALLDNFSWGNTEKADRLGALVRACEACRDVAIAFRTPFISGKDSLNNEYQVQDAGFGMRDSGCGMQEQVADTRIPKAETFRSICIPHTLLISAIGIVDDYRACVTMDLKKAGNLLYQIGLTRDEMGGSHLHRVLGLVGGEVPGVDLEMAPRIHEAVSAATRAGLIRSCHDLSEGGLAVAAAEMAFAGDLGMEIDIAHAPAEADEPTVRLFSESNTRYLVEVEPDKADAFAAQMAGLPFAKLGEVVPEPLVRIRRGSEVCVEEALENLKSSWLNTLKVLDD